jgi:hypothetical protein
MVLQRSRTAKIDPMLTLKQASVDDALIFPYP